MDTNEIYELLLNKISSENILRNESMKSHTSFKIGGEADFFVKAKSIDEIKYILSICENNNIPLTLIGNGSNLLVSDNGIKGIVLKVEMDNISIDDFHLPDHKVVTVGAGVLLGKLAQILCKNSLSGFEFASGIPGTIGGAIRMNAGAYGSEFKDIVLETTCMDMKGNVRTFNNNEQKFDYRKSIFKDEKYIILECKLLLNVVQDNQIIKNKMDEFKQKRIATQPVDFPSAGSTFKRGEDFITAKLIDECGLKGKQIGGAMVSEKHAGFIINTGNATAQDVLELVSIVKKEVYNKFQKNVELEVEVIE